VGELVQGPNTRFSDVQPEVETGERENGGGFSGIPRCRFSPLREKGRMRGKLGTGSWVFGTSILGSGGWDFGVRETAKTSMRESFLSFTPICRLPPSSGKIVDIGRSVQFVLW